MTTDWKIVRSSVVTPGMAIGCEVPLAGLNLSLVHRMWAERVASPCAPLVWSVLAALVVALVLHRARALAEAAIALRRGPGVAAGAVTPGLQVASVVTAVGFTAFICTTLPGLLATSPAHAAVAVAIAVLPPIRYTRRHS